MLVRWLIWLSSALLTLVVLMAIRALHIFLWKHLRDSWWKRLLLRDWRIRL